MLQGRVLCRVSLLIILIIALSAYAPWDFLGVYDKARAAETFLQDDEKISATGYVYHKEIKNDKVLYYVKNASVTSRSGTLSKTSFIFKLESDLIPTFCKLNIDGRIKHFSQATNEGCFDKRAYYNSLGLYFELSDVTVKDYKSFGVSKYDFGYRIRTAISGVFSACLPAEEAGLLSSVVIGEKGSLDAELKALFQNVGIAHILAVSGLHISVVCMAIYSFLRGKIGVGFWWSSCCAGVVAVIYGFLTGGSISSVRAIGMFLIFLGAQVAGESYDLLTALAVMADYLLVDEPLYITNVSFIFSFGAVIAIFYVAVPLNNVYANYCRCRLRTLKCQDGFYVTEVTLPRRLLQYIISSFIFSFGMFAGMLPIVTQLFYQTPMYGVFLNLMVLPLMPVLLGVGLVAGVVGLFCLPVARMLLLACHLVIYFYEMACDLVNRLPFSTVIVGRREMTFVLIYYLLLLGVIYGIGRLKVEKLFQFRRKLLGVLVGLIVLSIAWMTSSKGTFEIDVLDVGQGDGIYINSGDGISFFIDGGSTSSEEVGKYTLLPFLKYKGVRSIDYWFVSHTDEDHVSGLIELLDSGYRIENIVFTNCIPRDGNEAFAEINRLAEATGTQVLFMRQGDVIGSKHIRFECVYPGVSVANLYSDDVNALSLSLLMSYDRNCDEVPEYTAFFGGDLAAEQERIIASSGLVGHVDLLKVCHHGSRFSSDSAFLQTLSPDTAIISCAKHNLYGHPADEAVDRLEKAGTRIYYTMNNGRIRVDGDGVDIFLHD